MASYEDSEIYKLAKRLAVEIHKMTLEDLPKFERKALIEGRAN